MLIGFIGQGFIGKNYADDFENRGYEVVRYALEEPYLKNNFITTIFKIICIIFSYKTLPYKTYQHIYISLILIYLQTRHHFEL